jgi:hypothetical protein
MCENPRTVDDELAKWLRRLDERLEADERDRSETRQFMRELNIRYERSFQIVAERLAAETAELADGRDQLRANTAATWAMVDLLRGST